MNREISSDVKNKGFEWIDNLLKKDITYTEIGSIAHLLYGKKPSEQSMNIKIGYFGEFLVKEIIKSNNDFQLLSCGCNKINDKNKDIDLIFKDEKNKIIYYRELKGNIRLDTEKIPATINKCNLIKKHLITENPDYKIDYGILNWSVYNRKDLNVGLSNIKCFETNDIKIEHFEDFLEIIKIKWEKKISIVISEK